MNQPCFFSSSLTPIHPFYVHSRLRSGLASTSRSALIVSRNGVTVDFSTLNDDPWAITWDHLLLALHAKHELNDMPMLAIVSAFRDQILGQLDHLWTVCLDRTPLTTKATMGVAWCLFAHPEGKSGKNCFSSVLEQVKRLLAREHEKAVNKLHLSVAQEATRDCVHNMMISIGQDGLANPEATVAKRVGIPFLRVVQLLSLAGPANLTGPMPASDAAKMHDELCALGLVNQRVSEPL